jgi:23S rRNA pseudouridine1911/1915/1917 synthase
VHVNGEPVARVARRLALGDVVAVDADPRPPRAIPRAEAAALEILYEDDDLLVVVKPAGIVVHPTAAWRGGTVMNALLGHAASAGGTRAWRPHLVHRLDRGTSGVLAVAKSGDVHAALQRAQGTSVKDYLAVVWGTPRPGRGTIAEPLGRDPLDRRRVVVRASGSLAQTSYRCLARSTGPRRGVSLIACRLHTGRTHQIRVHLAGAGWPIVGDGVYGRPPRSRVEDPALDRHLRGFPRPALHAWQLTLRLPSSGRVTTFEAPPPSDLEALLRLAGLRMPSASAIVRGS